MGPVKEEPSSCNALQVIDLVSAVKELHGLSSQELGKLLKDSDNFTIQYVTEKESLLKIDVEKLASFLPLHLIAVLMSSEQDEALFRYLLCGIRLLHSLCDLAPRNPKLEQILLDDVKVSEQLLDLVFYILIVFSGYEQKSNNFGMAPLMHSALVACTLHLLTGCISSQWQDLVQVLLAHPKFTWGLKLLQNLVLVIALCTLLCRNSLICLLQLLNLCEAESISYLDEVASSPGSLDLAKSVALEIIDLLKCALGKDPKCLAAAEETDIGEDFTPQATEEIDLEASDADAAAEATSVRAKTVPASGETLNTTCSDPPTVSSPQTSMEVALMDAIEMPSLAPEVVDARNLLGNLEQIDLADEECMPQISKAIATLCSCANESEMKHLEDLKFRLEQIPDLQETLHQKEQVTSECLQKQTALEEKFRSEKEQLNSQHSCILTGIDAEIRSLEKQRADIQAKIEAAKQKKTQHVQAVKTKIPELQKLKETTLAAAQATKMAKDDAEASRTDLKRTLLDIHLLGRLV
uniref:uncharacterized protein LOC105350094 n=1 Tax=Fragaria vesca subsp. vesca TaxID=101020 RepID=UPI0005C83631|nr:PREDICTED: uncharacterized protein LOC105350094 [Fragaria vesca subsp. vesca]